MTYQTIETTSLTNEADSNLPKEESKSSHRTWLGVVAAALLLGGGTMLASSSSLSSSSNANGTIRSNSVEGSLVDVGGCPYPSYIEKVNDRDQKTCVHNDCCYYSIGDCQQYGASYCYRQTEDNTHTLCCKYEAKIFGSPFADKDEVECCNNQQY